MVADPHPAMASAIAEVLGREPDTTVVTHTGNLLGLARMLARHRPDVLLLDPAILGGGRLQSLPVLTQASPGTRVLLMVMDGAGWDTAVARSGAAGYIPKSARAAAWGPAVAAAARREVAQAP